MKLTSKQIAIAALLATGITGREACESVGIDQTTLVRWKRSPEFSEYYEKLLSDAEQDAIDALRSLYSLAVCRLAALMESPNPAVSLRAVEAVLDRACKHRAPVIDENDPMADLLKDYAKFM